MEVLLSSEVRSSASQLARRIAKAIETKDRSPGKVDGHVKAGASRLATRIARAIQDRDADRETIENELESFARAILEQAKTILMRESLRDAG